MFVSLNLNTKTFKIASFIHLKHVYFHQLKNKIPRDVLFSLDPLNPKTDKKLILLRSLFPTKYILCQNPKYRLLFDSKQFLLFLR